MAGRVELYVAAYVTGGYFGPRAGRRSRRVVAQNLPFALGVIVVMVAATLFGDVTLPLGVVMHEGSAVLVGLYGLRLVLP